MKKVLVYYVPSWFTIRYHMTGQLRFCARNGYEVHVVSEKDTRAASAIASEEAIPHLVETRLEAYRTLAGLVSCNKKAVLCASTKCGGLIGSAVRVANRSTRFVYVVRGLSKGSAGPTRMTFYKGCEALICACADAVVLMSNSNRRWFLDNRLCRKSGLHVMGEGSVNGIDTQHYRLSPEVIKAGADLRRAHRIPSSAFVFGFVGRLVREKGLNELAEAWRAMHDRANPPHLLVAAPPEVQKEAQEAVRRLREVLTVHLIGFHENPVPVYAAMNCLVLPSYAEGFSTAILEAAALGTPSIGSRVPGIIDAIVDGQTGVLVEARSTESLYQAMQRMITEPGLSTQLGEKARFRCHKSFAQEVVWNGYLELFNRLASAA